MNAAIIDASALLALLKKEPGADSVREQLAYPALISTVNYTEVLYGLRRHNRQFPWRNVLDAVEDLQLEVIPFSLHQAKLAANIHEMSRPFGLSLADCACLALTLDQQLPVLTADRTWLTLPFKVSIDIRAIR